MSKELYLGGKYGSIIGNYAIVDDDLYDELNQYSWSVRRSGKPDGGYTEYIKAYIKGKYVYLHRYILGVTDSKVLVDHKDRNIYHNTRENLRECSYTNNSMNRRKNRNSNRKYKGVSRSCKKEHWKASIGYDHNLICIGTYESEEDAAIAYDLKAIELYGEFACLNFPENDYSSIETPTVVNKIKSNTGYLNISFIEKRNRYTVTYEANNKKKIKFFVNLEDAIQYRDSENKCN